MRGKLLHVGHEVDRATAMVFMFVLDSSLSESAGVALTRRLRRAGSNADELIRDTMGHAKEIAMEFPRLRMRIDAVGDDGYPVTRVAS